MEACSTPFDTDQTLHRTVGGSDDSARCSEGSTRGEKVSYIAILFISRRVGFFHVRNESGSDGLFVIARGLGLMSACEAIPAQGLRETRAMPLAA